MATNAQVKHFLDLGLPAFVVDPLQLATGINVVQHALEWATPRLGHKPVLVYSTADTETVKAAQAQLGGQTAGELVEKALAAIASGLVERGVGQMIVAGGETSGACVQAVGHFPHAGRYAGGTRRAMVPRHNRTCRKAIASAVEIR